MQQGATCPGCGAARQVGAECPHCGVIYAQAERRARERAATEAEARAALVRSCPSCQGQVSVSAPTCPHCGEVFQAPARWPVRALLGYGGAAVLALGVWAPIVRLPMVGPMNYFHNGDGDGIILLALAAVSVLVVALRRWFVLYGTGLGALAFLGHAIYDWNHRMALAGAKYSADMVGNPFAGIGQAMIESAQLEWGWAVLFVGAGLLVAAAALRDNR